MLSHEHLHSFLYICNIKIGVEVKGDVSSFFNSLICTRQYKKNKNKKNVSLNIILVKTYTYYRN